MKTFIMAVASIMALSMAACGSSEKNTQENDTTATQSQDSEVVGVVDVEQVTMPVDTLTTDSGKVVVEQTVTQISGVAAEE